jgi:hypothetical protein
LYTINYRYNGYEIAIFSHVVTSLPCKIFCVFLVTH